MSSRHTSSLLLALSLPLLLSCSSPSWTPLELSWLAWDSLENRYGFLTEEEFDENYRNKVLPYWDLYGRAGHFQGVDDVRIEYMTFIREDEVGAIVISSGLAESFIKYQEVIYDLGNQGYSMYIHDHRGQGFSERLIPDKPQVGHIESFAHYVLDLKYFVDHVVNQRHHKSLFLIAHSMGGTVASLYIQTYTDDFDAAILSAPMHEPHTGWLPVNAACKIVSIRKRLTSTPQDYAPGQGPYQDGLLFDVKRNIYTHSEPRFNKFREVYRRHPGARLGGPSNRWLHQACKAARKARTEAGETTIPVLILQASLDRAVTSKGQRIYCRNLNARQPGRCELFVLEGAKHEPYIERDDYRIPALEKTLDFMAAHTGG